MEDFGALVDAHTCSNGLCRKWTHAQEAMVAPADVADPAAEIATLVVVRDSLLERGLQMLEGDPTPRWASGDDLEPKSWTVKYEPVLGPTRGRRGRPAAAVTSGADAAQPSAAPKRRNWLQRLWTPER